MSSDSQTISVYRRDDIVHVDLLAPQLVGDEAIERLADEVVRVIEAEAVPRIVMNFERVQYVSSTMLGMLLTLYNRVRARGGQLRLAALRKRHQRLLVVTRLNTLFEVYPTPEQAAASLK